MSLPRPYRGLGPFTAVVILLRGCSGQVPRQRICSRQAPRTAIVALAPDLKNAHDIGLAKEALEHATRCWQTNCTDYRYVRSKSEVSAGVNHGLMPEDKPSASKLWKPAHVAHGMQYFGSTWVKWAIGTVLWSNIMNLTDRQHQAAGGEDRCAPFDVRLLSSRLALLA